MKTITSTLRPLMSACSECLSDVEYTIVIDGFGLCLECIGLKSESIAIINKMGLVITQNLNIENYPTPNKYIAKNSFVEFKFSDEDGFLQALFVEGWTNEKVKALNIFDEIGQVVLKEKNITTFTQKEKKLIGTLNSKWAEYEDDNGNYELHMINHLDLAEELGWTKEAVGAVLGSLEKKSIIHDSEHRGEENCVCWWVHNDEIDKVLA